MKIKVFTFIIFLILSSIAYGGDYVIGEGDVIRVSVWGEEELNLSVKVRPDGKIGVPASGEVEAAGYTPKELQKILTEKIKGIVKNPIVTGTIYSTQRNNFSISKGIQFQAAASLINEEKEKAARQLYYKINPMARLKKKTTIWSIKLQEIKMTNNKVGVSIVSSWDRKTSFDQVSGL